MGKLKRPSRSALRRRVERVISLAALRSSVVELERSLEVAEFKSKLRYFAKKAKLSVRELKQWYRTGEWEPQGETLKLLMKVTKTPKTPQGRMTASSLYTVLSSALDIPVYFIKEDNADSIIVRLRGNIEVHITFDSVQSHVIIKVGGVVFMLTTLTWDAAPEIVWALSGLDSALGVPDKPLDCRPQYVALKSLGLHE
jgi:hypothetical protein